ncbi:S-adenosyl-L-methionine-dependent methyltransferase [Gonapodya prolifera JEL478]|uniref:catechol O-methyltransferase n=1 Tax=Gonapodya prolifera (strain JEL478) TaxID=1344416 RepID=A0A139AIS4_GONPJ|nr:S-adenosyl-L-methionine-dependent methyltransferase [Gonapodya prolifera JEL478]|eukprot:KXS16690.1 S-adenosyl-L-methionine-dependent methyltransferase [Gonapodya prolifera JEL478]
MATDTTKRPVHEVILEKVKLQATPGDAQSVVDVMDKLGWDNHWHMSLGDAKAVFVRQAIREHKPRTLLELGTYIGYSATVIGSEMVATWKELGGGDPKPLLLSLDINETTTAVAKQIATIAGLVSPTGQSTVEFLVGDCLKIIPTLKERFPNGFDAVFIDCWKQLYLPSIKLLEEHGLLHSGSVVIGDNILNPGAPDFLAHVRNSPRYETTVHESTVEYTNDKDWVTVSKVVA